MKKFYFLLSFLISGLAGWSQSDVNKYAELITSKGLFNQLSIVASAEMEGRETGTEGQRKAAAYIESQFKILGLSKPSKLKGYQQLYPLYQDSLIKSTLTINKVEAEFGKDYINILNGNNSGSFNGKEIVFVGYGISDTAYDDYANQNVKGKVVVMFYGEPKKDGKYFINPTGKVSEWTFPGISKKLAVATEKGAVGVLMVNQNMETFNPRTVDNNKKTSVYYPRENTAKKVKNYVLITPQYANKILPAFDELTQRAKKSEAFTSKNVTLKTKVSYSFKKSKNVIYASNVLGVLEGTDKKDEYVFVTAHYDHLGIRDGKIYYGADDDGSGTVAVIEMAAAFAKAKAEGKGPRRTIVFMTVSGEEKGLWGSEYYSDNPVFPLDKTTVDLNIDMIGRIDTERKTADTLSYVYVVGHDKLSSELKAINEGANDRSSKITLDYKFDDPNDPNKIYFRSDHYNFARKGVPVLFFYDGMLKADYHKPTDTIEKINWPIFESRARMIFHTAWEMANRDNMLVRDIPLPAGSR